MFMLASLLAHSYFVVMTSSALLFSSLSCDCMLRVVHVFCSKKQTGTPEANTTSKPSPGMFKRRFSWKDSASGTSGDESDYKKVLSDSHVLQLELLTE